MTGKIARRQNQVKSANDSAKSSGSAGQQKEQQRRWPEHVELRRLNAPSRFAHEQLRSFNGDRPQLVFPISIKPDDIRAAEATYTTLRAETKVSAFAGWLVQAAMLEKDVVEYVLGFLTLWSNTLTVGDLAGKAAETHLRRDVKLTKGTLTVERGSRNAEVNGRERREIVAWRFEAPFGRMLTFRSNDGRFLFMLDNRELSQALAATRRRRRNEKERGPHTLDLGELILLWLAWAKNAVRRRRHDERVARFGKSKNGPPAQFVLEEAFDRVLNAASNELCEKVVMATLLESRAIEIDAPLFGLPMPLLESWEPAYFRHWDEAKRGTRPHPEAYFAIGRDSWHAAIVRLAELAGGVRFEDHFHPDTGEIDYGRRAKLFFLDSKGDRVTAPLEAVVDIARLFALFSLANLALLGKPATAFSSVVPRLYLPLHDRDTTAAVRLLLKIRIMQDASRVYGTYTVQRPGKAARQGALFTLHPVLAGPVLRQRERPRMLSRQRPRMLSAAPMDAVLAGIMQRAWGSSISRRPDIAEPPRPRPRMLPRARPSQVMEPSPGSPARARLRLRAAMQPLRRQRGGA